MNDFFNTRMQNIGATPDDLLLEVFDPTADFPQPSDYTISVFEPNNNGDIIINYYDVDGQVIRYDQVGDGKTSHLTARERFYKTTRLREPKGDMKYVMPVGQPTHPWFPPSIVKKFNAKTPIKTLILTEGAFKAMSGALIGLDVVGLPSITCYKDRNGKLYADIVRLIEVCQVQRVIILWDGDCLNISQKDLRMCEELTNRPLTFYSSAKKIRDLIAKADYAKPRDMPTVHFACIRSEAHPDNPKGLDDLIVLLDAQARSHLLLELSDDDKRTPRFYTNQINITSSTSQMYKYFRLDDVNAFYQLHINQIESQQFLFNGSTYQWSEIDNELKVRKPEWAKRVFWVGDEFFLDDLVPTSRGGSQRRLVKYKDTQFTRMFGKDFWLHLEHHRAFVNIPSHNNYQQVIETGDGAKYYNRYYPFAHTPNPGNFNTIITLLTHLFGTKKVTHALSGELYDPIELALDYIQSLYITPTQALPIICFYSAENNTGKSTFGKLMHAMFGDNCIQIGNADLQSDFNEPVADKLLVICEETLLERKADAERLKAMSTSDRITVNPKNQAQYSIDFFAKFIFTSNNLRMIYLSRHDQRYWIIKVPQIERENPHMLEEMKAEIPAFLHFLANRKMATKNEGRMWFHPSLLKTDVFADMVKVNEPTDASNLRATLTEWFVADEELTELRMTLKEIREEFFPSNSKTPWVQEILRDYLGVDLLRNEKGIPIQERGYYTKLEKQFFQNIETYVRVSKPYRGRPYLFKREQFVHDGDVAYDTSQPASDTAPQPAVVQPAHPPVIAQAMAEPDTPF